MPPSRPFLLPRLWSAGKPLGSWAHLRLHLRRWLPQHKSASSPFHHWRPCRCGAQLIVIAHVTSCDGCCIIVIGLPRAVTLCIVDLACLLLPVLPPWLPAALLLSAPSARQAVGLTYTLFHTNLQPEISLSFYSLQQPDQAVQPIAQLEAPVWDQDTPPPAMTKEAAAPPCDNGSATALPQEPYPPYEALQVPGCPLDQLTFV